MSGKSPARLEAEEYAGGAVGRIVMDGRPIGMHDLLELVAGAYERGRTAPVRGRLLERVARAHYASVSRQVRQAVDWERLDPDVREGILDAVRTLLDRMAVEASTPEPDEEEP